MATSREGADSVGESAHRAAVAPRRRHGSLRRARSGIVAAECLVAAIVGGILLGGRDGWLLAGVGALVALGLTGAGLRRRWRRAAPAAAPADLLGQLRVLGVRSRASGDVGVITDRQGMAAGVEVLVRDRIDIDLRTVSAGIAADPSRPAGLQFRVTGDAPPASHQAAFDRPRGGTTPVVRRVHLLLRFEPAWADDVVRAHGGGAEGGRVALVAAVDRLSAALRDRGTANRVLDPDALTELLAQDTAANLTTSYLVADPARTRDPARLLDRLRESGVTRSVLSVCVDLTVGEQWRSCAVLALASADPVQLRPACRKVLADPLVLGLANQSAARQAAAAVWPLGGGPADLTAALTLARV